MEADHQPYPFAGGLIYLDAHRSPARIREAARRRAEGTFEPRKVAAVQRFVEPGMTFVDAGANMGDYSLIAARAMGDHGLVVAFEPEPWNFGWLERNVALNGYCSVRCVQMALGDADREGELFIGDGIGRHTMVPLAHHQETIQVEVRTLDSVLPELGVERVDLMKVDVEGAELRVLRGAAETLARSDELKLFIDIHPGRQDPRPVCELLSDLGFSLRDPADPDRELGEVARDLKEVFAFRR